MTHEKSCGAVVFTREGGEIKYLVIKSLTGIYGFPKGHVEQGETEEETALREVLEETGISVSLLSGFRVEEEYPLPQKEDTIKRVVYFLGEYCDQEPRYQASELTDALLVDYETAMSLFQFDVSRRILTEADKFLAGKN
ncbi:MAG: NUDIX domain-containing protein [Clostridia bacterium]|nr:NUDIX domain-containing protein [Clostridia bacterium]